MQTVPLIVAEGHLFVTLDGRDWLLDTGAPGSFGTGAAVTIAGRSFPVAERYLGLSAATLSESVGHPTAGLLGADVLNAFDLLLDAPAGEATFAEEPLALDGTALETSAFMGIPLIEARIAGTARRMFFDTGAQISYFQDDSLATFPPAGSVTDFYPGFGTFETETHQVEMAFGTARCTLRCGTLPGLLGMTLMMAGTEGIVGNELVRGRKAGLFPRRGRLVLA